MTHFQARPANDPQELDIEIWRKRLWFRSVHRGSKELDFLFKRFAEKHLDALDIPQMHALEALMAEPDVDCYNWLMGKATPPKEHAETVAMMRAV